MEECATGTDGVSQQPEYLKHAKTDAERYRLLVDSITDYAIFMLDPSGVIATWNAGAQRIKGYTEAEIVGQHFSVFYTPADVAAGLPDRILQTAIKEGRFEQEGWRVRKNGARFWAHVVIDPIRGRNGELAGFAKVTRDLTERMKAREALRQSEEQFRRLVQGVTDYAIYMLSPEGNVSSWNAGAERIKGYSEAEVVGTHFSRFYTEEDIEAGLPERGLAAAASQGRWEREGWRVRKDGTRFLAHVIIDAIRDEHGKLVGFAKITRDVTERKRQQEALEQAQIALMQAQKMESLGQLTGGIAHDFNNLLTAILNSLELLRKWLPDNPRAHALLDNALHGAERGSSLTSRMLAFARRQELRIEVISLHVLVAGLVGLMERTIGPSVSIEVRLPASLPNVRIDAGQLENAMLNLAINARDAMPSGGRIIIAGRAEALGEHNHVGVRPGRYVALSLADTGQGMDENTLSRAAEPFFTTKGPGKGTGLGLSMVHGLAEQAGGKLQVTSQLGAGTIVTLWIPEAVGDVAATAKKPADEAQREGKIARVLVVDDDSLVRISAAALLEELGYSVVEAESGAQALEAVASDPTIELVLTDQLMPGMTGLQLVQAIRALNSSLPVILATGYAELSQKLPAGVQRLAKPFRAADVQKAIAAATGGCADQSL